jgi:recombination protein RecA
MIEFKSIVDKFNKKYGSDIITNGLKTLEYDAIPFSSVYLNYMLHGGFPRARVVEFFGPESGGKTTTALDVVKNAQIVFKKEWEDKVEKLSNSTKKSDKLELEKITESGPLKCVYFDLEHTLNEEWARMLGVNLEENFYLVSPDSQSAEELLDLIVDMVSSEEVGLVVLDSICYLEPMAELNESLEKKSYGGISKLLSSFFRKVTPYLHKFTASLLIINQLRDSMDLYKLYDTPGGRALKHACSVRIMFKKGELYNEKFEAIKRSSELAFGNQVSVKIEKSKISKPDRIVGFYKLSYYSGIEKESELADFMLKFGLITQAGSWFTFIDPESGEILDGFKAQGMPKVVELLKNNPELFNLYTTYINNNMIK